MRRTHHSSLACCLAATFLVLSLFVGGAFADDNSTAGTENLAYYISNGGVQISTLNTYVTKTLPAGSSLYLYYSLTGASKPSQLTVAILPADATAVYGSSIAADLRVGVSTQPTTSDTAQVTVVKQDLSYDGSGIEYTLSGFSDDEYILVEVVNSNANVAYNLMYTISSNPYEILSSMGSVKGTFDNADPTQLVASSATIFEIPVPTGSWTVATQLLSVLGSSQLYLCADDTTAKAIASGSATASQKLASIQNNNYGTKSFTALSKFYAVVTVVSGVQVVSGYQANWTLTTYTYASTEVIPYNNWVAGNGGSIVYQRSDDMTVEFSWTGLDDADSSSYSSAVIDYTFYLGVNQNDFNSVFNSAGQFPSPAVTVTDVQVSTKTTSTLSTGTDYYYGVIATITNYGSTAGMQNIPPIRIMYQPAKYRYDPPSSTSSGGAGIGVGIFFLVLLLVIVIILSIVLYLKFRAKKLAESGTGVPTRPPIKENKPESSAPKTSTSAPKKKDEPASKVEYDKVPTKVPPKDQSAAQSPIKPNIDLQLKPVDHAYNVGSGSPPKNPPNYAPPAQQEPDYNNYQPDQYGQGYEVDNQYGQGYDNQYNADAYNVEQNYDNQYRADQQYNADQYAADQYGADQYGADQYGADQYGADGQNYGDQYAGADQQQYDGYVVPEHQDHNNVEVDYNQGGHSPQKGH